MPNTQINVRAASRKLIPTHPSSNPAQAFADLWLRCIKPNEPACIGTGDRAYQFYKHAAKNAGEPMLDPVAFKIRMARRILAIGGISEASPGDEVIFSWGRE